MSLSYKNRAARIWTIVAIAALHFLIRHTADGAIPLAERAGGMFGGDYRVALNLMSGRGFRQSLCPDAPEAVPVREFTSFLRPELTRAELDAYLRQPWSRPINYDFRTHRADVPIPDVDRAQINEFYTMRVLDLRVAAILWRWFGIRWSVFFTFYQLVSTGTGVLLFLIVKRFVGFWAGVLAFLFYTVSPLEIEWTIRGVRDISPLWFAIIALAALFCLAGRFKSGAKNSASYLVAGAISLIGYGWRIDAIMLPAIMLVLLAIDGMVRRKRYRDVFAQMAWFSCGALLCLGLIRSLTPQGGMNPQNGFHIAYYGNSERTNLSGLENSLKIFRCDINTQIAARYHADANGIPGGGVPYLSPAYGAACRAMYLKAISFDAWHWISGFPRFLFRAMRGTALKDLPADREFYPPPTAWPKWMQTLRLLVAGPISDLTPYLVILGLLGVLFWIPVSALSTGMTVLFVLYGVILFAVLPEGPHAGLLVIPMCVLAALGTSTFSRKRRHLRWRTGSIVLLTIATIWGLGCGAGYFWSLRQRDAQVAAIRLLTSNGALDPAAQIQPQLFRVRRGHSSPDPAGYLIEIETGDAPGILHCRYLRDGIGLRVYQSDHRLHPNRKQFFFFTSYLGAREGSAEYDTTVVLERDARIVSARRSDLAGWKGLEASTVFYDGERTPGSPIVGYPSEVTNYANNPFDGDLLSATDRVRLFPTRPLGLDVSTAPPHVLKETGTSSPLLYPVNLWGLALATLDAQGDHFRFKTTLKTGQGYVQGPAMTSLTERDIYVRMRYRLGKGRMALLVQTYDGTRHAYCPQPQAAFDGQLWTEAVRFHVFPKQPFCIVVANEYPPFDAPAEADIVEIALLTE
jgi:hypothetical protein